MPISKLQEKNDINGFTLIELMIAITLGLMIISAVTTVYISTLRSSTGAIGSAKLNHDLGTTALLIANDIRRAGYWGGAVTGSDSNDNPFTQGTANLQIPQSDCVLYTYDAVDASNALNSNGTVDSGDHYGFKLNNGTIQMKLSGATTANCNDGTWQNILESDDIDITSLIFSFYTDASSAISNVTADSKCLNVSNTAQIARTDCSTAIAGGTITAGEIVETRQVVFEITGTLDDDGSVTKVVSGSVKVRNDRTFTQP